MKNYAIYQLKKAFIPFAVVLFAGLIFYVIPLIVPVYNFSNRMQTVAIYYAFAIIAACMLMPVWAFRYKMNRRSTDLYFSLPIKRHDLLVIHYLSGFIAIVAAYTVVFWLGFIVIAAKSTGFALINMLWLYLSSLPCIYIVYSIYSFAYTRANNVIDGLIFIVFATFAVMVAAVIIYVAAWTRTESYWTGSDGETVTYLNNTYYISPIYYMPFMPLYVLQEYFTELTANESAWYFSSPLRTEDVNIIAGIVINALLSVACTAGLVLQEKRNKSENCEQNSDSPFGYRVMIPLFEFALCADVVLESEIIVLLMVVAAGYFGTAIWKRSFKIGWKAAIVLAVSVAAGLIYGGITYFAHYGFGAA